MNTRRATSRRTAESNVPDTKTPAVANSRHTRSATPSTRTDDTTNPSVRQRPPESKNQTNTPPSPPTPVSPQDFRKVFNSIYQRFYKFNEITVDDKMAVATQVVDMEEFDRLTENKQYARYVSLLDGRVIFHEVPNAPHGEVIDSIAFSISTQLDRTKFIGAVDNGRIPQIPSLLRRLYFRYRPHEPNENTPRLLLAYQETGNTCTSTVDAVSSKRLTVSQHCPGGSCQQRIPCSTPGLCQQVFLSYVLGEGLDRCEDLGCW